MGGKVIKACFSTDCYFIGMKRNILVIFHFFKIFNKKFWEENTNSHNKEKKKSSHIVKKKYKIIFTFVKKTVSFTKKRCEGFKSSHCVKKKKVSHFWEPPPHSLEGYPPFSEIQPSIIIHRYARESFSGMFLAKIIVSGKHSNTFRDLYHFKDDYAWL